jgi:hypothetical protein
MKKQDKILKISTILVLLFFLTSCTDSGYKSWTKYYQLCNESGKNLTILLYFHSTKENFDSEFKDTIFIDTLCIKDKARSEIYDSYFCAPEEKPYYLEMTDSMDIVSNGVFIKGYTRYNAYTDIKSPYNTDLYQESKDNSGKIIYIYTFLAEDFE